MAHTDATPRNAWHVTLGMTGSEIRRKLRAQGLQLKIRLAVTQARRSFATHRDLAANLLARLAEMMATMAVAMIEMES